MSYILNGIYLASFGFTPGRQANSNLALSGFLDMPARLGKTFHDWGDEHGVEPYVTASQIRFGGRDLQLIGWITGTDKQDCYLKSESLVSFVKSFTGLVPLVTQWGTYQVKINSVPIEYLADKGLAVTINMREPVVDITGSLPASDNDDYGIDNISFSALGGFLTEFKGQRRGMPEVKSEQFTAWQKEGYQITKTQAAKIEFGILVQADTYAAFKTKITSLYALFSKSGTRLMNVKEDAIREFFVTEGFRLTTVYKNQLKYLGVVTVTAIQVNNDFYYLTDNSGNFITDNSLNKIIIR